MTKETCTRIYFVGFMGVGKSTIGRKLAEKLGFERVYVSRNNAKGLKQQDYKIELVFVRKIEEVFGGLFG